MDGGSDETGGSAENRAFYAGLDSIVGVEGRLLRSGLDGMWVRHLDSSPKEAIRKLGSRFMGGLLGGGFYVEGGAN